MSATIRMAANGGYAIREFKPEDVSYVKSTWTESYRQMRATSSIESRIYYKEQRRMVDRLVLEAATGELVLAVDPEATDVIYGWACGRKPKALERPGILHYVYVRQEWRRLGIGTDLIQAIVGLSGEPFFVTHLPNDPMFFQRVARTALFNPYLLMR